MRKGFCGRIRDECGYSTVCRGCWNPMCLLARCIRGITFEGITTPRSFCTYRKVCHRAGGKLPLPAEFSTEQREPQPRVKHPKFVPLIELADPRSWFWPDANKPMIAVRLGDVLLNNEIADKVLASGLHDYTGFNGQIMLSTIMPDELLDRLTASDYRELIDGLRPDSCMVPDCYTYLDDPQVVSWQQLFKMMSQAEELLDLDTQLLGLIKGGSNPQIKWCIERLLDMGFRTLVFPARELVKTKYLRSIVLTILYTLKKCNEDVNLLVYGTSRPIHLMPRKQTSYATMSWHINAEYGYYRLGKWVYEAGDTEIRFDECNCPGCRDRMAYELAPHTRDLGIHNLLQLEKHLASQG